MVEIMNLFDGMDVVEIDAFIKDEVRPYLKERKIAEKAEKIATAKSKVSEGDFVSVRFKDKEITGTVVSLREKTFSILTDEILNAKGEPSRISRGYDFIVAVADTETEAEAV